MREKESTSPPQQREVGERVSYETPDSRQNLCCARGNETEGTESWVPEQKMGRWDVAGDVAPKRDGCWRWRGCSNVVVVVVVTVLVMTMCGSVQCYNVDTVTAVVHQGKPGSMFGFSVAQHIDQSTNW